MPCEYNVVLIEKYKLQKNMSIRFHNIYTYYTCMENKRIHTKLLTVVISGSELSLFIYVFRTVSMFLQYFYNFLKKK